MVLILSKRDLEELLTMGDVLEALEMRFREFKEGYCMVAVGVCFWGIA
jgi:hypothetical protein